MVLGLVVKSLVQMWLVGVVDGDGACGQIPGTGGCEW